MEAKYSYYDFNNKISMTPIDSGRYLLKRTLIEVRYPY